MAAPMAEDIPLPTVEAMAAASLDERESAASQQSYRGMKVFQLVFELSLPGRAGDAVLHASLMKHVEEDGVL